MEEVLLRVNFAHYIFIVCDTTKLDVLYTNTMDGAKFYIEERRIKVKDRRFVKWPATQAD